MLRHPPSSGRAAAMTLANSELIHMSDEYVLPKTSPGPLRRLKCSLRRQLLPSPGPRRRPASVFTTSSSKMPRMRMKPGVRTKTISLPLLPRNVPPTSTRGLALLMVPLDCLLAHRARRQSNEVPWHSRLTRSRTILTSSLLSVEHALVGVARSTFGARTLWITCSSICLLPPDTRFGPCAPVLIQCSCASTGSQRTKPCKNTFEGTAVEYAATLSVRPDFLVMSRMLS